MSRQSQSERSIHEQRRHPRVKISMPVGITISNDGELIAKTRDISDGGLFLILDHDELPKVGETVTVQVQGLPGGEAPRVEMEVVRTEPDGVGLKIKN